MINFRKYLMGTYILSGIIFVSLLGWTYLEAANQEEVSRAFLQNQIAKLSADDGLTPEEREAAREADRIAAENAREEEEPDYSIDFYGVSAMHPIAAEAGMEVMEAGGTAVDAAIAISFVLNVVEPYGSGMGGGGALVLHDPEEGVYSYDYREISPLSASSSWGGPERGMAVPGMVMGMETLHQDHGTLSWEALLEPSIKIAREGFRVTEMFHIQAINGARYLKEGPVQERLYPDGHPINNGALLVMPELADSLEKVQQGGSEAFYQGEIAEAIRRRTGMTEADLLAYDVNVDEPAKGEFHFYDESEDRWREQTIYGAANPTSAIVTIQALQMASQLDLSEYYQGANMEEGFFLGDLLRDEALTGDYIHLMNEIIRVTYEDRLDTIGDPDFEEVDQDALTSLEYTEELLSEVRMDPGNEPSMSEIESLFDSPGERGDPKNTTHFVVVDREGRMVSVTNTLGELFGAGIEVGGFFMNNQSRNFSDDPESPNYYQPGKRPRTFVSPLILEEHGRPVLGMGTPGGRRIPTHVFQTIMQFYYGKDEGGNPLDLQEAIMKPRFYFEDGSIYVEEPLDDAVISQLREKGWSVRTNTSSIFYGGIQALGLEIDENGFVKSIYGGGDDRRRGTWQIKNWDGEE
ncbi:gamma-glutamyltransferase family protein [Isachenkonia alkalipeptolytica]|uniref:Gamma-glutamyltransferase n=1 Tax=Isachenkonia alkalipeptolytica TaxID=2565777 RepID=A0AA43XL26_9CLOT|nr:gamma-glutamyltransferase [Isachenkonia alkalipeptolytica]NBG88697.1 hypothetical protein [Isachenkonia alkalipeptolytica]